MKKFTHALFLVGSALALVGAAVYITRWSLSPYIYTIGATMVALAQVNTPVKTSTVTLKRLRMQQIFGAIFLVLAGFCMFFFRHNEWIVCLTIAAVFELYTSFRIPHELEKEGE